MTGAIRDHLVSQEEFERLFNMAKEERLVQEEEKIDEEDLLILDKMLPIGRDGKSCPSSNDEMKCFQPKSFGKCYCYVQLKVSASKMEI